MLIVFLSLNVLHFEISKLNLQDTYIANAMMSTWEGGLKFMNFLFFQAVLPDLHNACSICQSSFLQNIGSPGKTRLNFYEIFLPDPLFLHPKNLRSAHKTVL